MANKTLQIRCKEETAEKFNEFAKRLGFKQGEALDYFLEVYEKYDRVEPNCVCIGLSEEQYFLLEDAISFRIYYCEEDVERHSKYIVDDDDDDDYIKKKMAELENYIALQKHIRKR